MLALEFSDDGGTYFCNMIDVDDLIVALDSIQVLIFQMNGILFTEFYFEACDFFKFHLFQTLNSQVNFSKKAR